MYAEGWGRFACPEVHTEVFIYSGAIQNMEMRVLQDELDGGMRGEGDTAERERAAGIQEVCDSSMVSSWAG